jgi:hypothetical protein
VKRWPFNNKVKAGGALLVAARRLLVHNELWLR